MEGCLRAREAKAMQRDTICKTNIAATLEDREHLWSSGYDVSLTR